MCYTFYHNSRSEVIGSSEAIHLISSGALNRLAWHSAAMRNSQITSHWQNSLHRNAEWYGPRYQGSWGQHGAHLDPVGPRWAPVGPTNRVIWGMFEICYRFKLWLWLWLCFFFTFSLLWKLNLSEVTRAFSKIMGKTDYNLDLLTVTSILNRWAQ